MDDLRWLIGFFLGIQFLGRTSFAQGSVLSVPEDFINHGPQYRFQYFVRDERGDYKTQEEAGEGGNARGSYAVEEPDGDLRIVQYTADLGGGFKAHIKVDHAGKSPSKLQEIDIPAEEMRKLINENRKKTGSEVPEVQKSSKSYALGPPRKMSDIVMEQAAAIREIISKEIEAEERREAAERLRGGKTGTGDQSGVDVVDCEKKNLEKGSEEVESEDESIKIDDGSIEATRHSNVRTAKARKFDVEASQGVDQASDENSESSQISNASGSDALRNTAGKKTAPLNEEEQSPVVRVALSPKTAAGMHQGKTNPRNNPREYSGREAHMGTPDPALVGPLLGGPVRNFSFKNRIMFYKPTERKADSNPSQERTPDSKDVAESFGTFDDYGLKLGDDREQIVLYSPYEEGESHGDRKGRYIKVPYEVLRPYFTSAEFAEGEEKKSERRK